MSSAVGQREHAGDASTQKDPGSLGSARDDTKRTSRWRSRARRRGDPRMCFEEFPDYVGRVQIVAWLADPFFWQPIPSAWPHVAEPFDRVVNDLAAFCALIVCDFIDAVARASRG